MRGPELAAVDFDLAELRDDDARRALLTRLCEDLSRQLSPANLRIVHGVIETPGGPVDTIAIYRKSAA